MPRKYLVRFLTRVLSAMPQLEIQVFTPSRRQPPATRVAVALIAPLGFSMGMPFPSGLARVGQGPFPAAPFYWGLNGVLSVVGSVGTMALAVNVGFRLAMIAGSLFYVLAALAARALDRPAEGAV